MRRSAFGDEGLPGLDRLDRTSRRVLGLVVVAFVARLAFLGARVAHYDEGRVGWWSLHFLDTGQFEYRYIIHGPLVQHVNKFLFDIAGANDFTMRLFVAVVGALLPLSALLFREHLDGDEVVGMAFFLALSPLLLYYSRFFRSTLLVAAFSLVAFGSLVRAYDTRSVWYVHAAVVLVALAFTAKENAAVYLLVWLGATALLVDHSLFRTGEDRAGIDWLLDRVETDRSYYTARVPQFLGHLALAVVVFLAITLYFYAPRSPGAEAVGFWQAVGNPTLLPDLFDRTLDDVVEGYSYWFGGPTGEPGCRKDSLIEAYGCFLGQQVHAMAQSALALVAMSLVGFVAERYGRPRSRYVVLFTFYWGFVSVLGYPLGTDIANAWIGINALVPLSLPAGVGLGLVLGRARGALAVEQADGTTESDPVLFGIIAFVLLVLVAQMAFAATTSVYQNGTSENNELVQYAQPADDFRPAMAVLEDHAADHQGTDVLFVGSTYVRDNPRADGIEPLCTSISDVLPVQWYVAAYGDATGDCIQDADTAVQRLQNGTSDPLVVIAPSSLEDDLSPALEGYDAEEYGLRTYGSEAVFFTDRSRGGETPAANATAG